MGRHPTRVDGLSEADHLTLGLELGAVASALKDIRDLITAKEGSGSEAYSLITRTMTSVKAAARVLDEDLRNEYGAKVENRKCYKEALM